jgi:hypothetical protein
MKKKILAALSALTLGATMMGSLAMTANAATLVDEDENTPVTVTNADGTTSTYSEAGFYAYWRDINGDGTINESDYEVAPYGMYDGAIDVPVVYNADGTVTVDFVVSEFEAHGYTVKGYISSIVDSNNMPVLTGVPTVNSTTALGTAAGTAVLVPGQTYTLVATFLTGYGGGTFDHTFPVKIVLS